jgi:hypothetical protein
VRDDAGQRKERSSSYGCDCRVHERPRAISQNWLKKPRAAAVQNGATVT